MCLRPLYFYFQDICATTIRLMVATDIYVRGSEPDYSAMVSASGNTQAMNALDSINSSHREPQTKRQRVCGIFRLYVKKHLSSSLNTILICEQ